MQANARPLSYIPVATRDVCFSNVSIHTKSGSVIDGQRCLFRRSPTYVCISVCMAIRYANSLCPACISACVRACVCACVRAWEYVGVCASVCVCTCECA